MKKEKTVMKDQTTLPEVIPAADVEIVDTEKLSKRLDNATAYIQKEVSNVAKSFCRIGFKLWDVKENKLYLGQGFKNIYEYGEKVLGFRKSSTANYIAICERFSVYKNDKPTAQLVDNFAGFSYGQLSLMLSLPEEKLSEITPEVSCKEIREMKKGDTSEGVLDDPGSDPPIKCIAPPIVLFDRVLTQDHVPMIIKVLRENIGREMFISVEYSGATPVVAE